MQNTYTLLIKTLDELDLHDLNSKTLFLNSNGANPLQVANITHYQPFKSQKKKVGDTVSNLDDLQGKYALAFILGTKNVKETQYMLAKAFSCLEDNGVVIIAADNKENGKRFEKWASLIGLKAQIHSGNKARCAVLRKTPDLHTFILQQWEVDGKQQENEGGFLSQAGLFSWDRIDPASRVLIETINEPLKGHVADFGCGYGYLSKTAADNNPKIRSVSGFDADARALKCYEQNLISHADNTSMHWTDLSAPYKHSHLFDFILMNPPFHEGRKEASMLGTSFIQNASHNLKRNGVLWMVANAHLPYETSLKEHFFSFEQIAHKNGFKVIRAVK